MERFDVVVVGARCAGSPLAMMLARRGLSVCLLDKSRFPSETLSTHVVQPCGVAVLDRLGVLDTILAAGAMPLTRFTLVSEGSRMEATIGDGLFPCPALSIRRVTLDHLLIEGAASLGVDVRTGTRVTGLLRENGRVVGVEAGSTRLRARLVVGADGRGSTVAELAGARKYHLAPPERMFAWAYFEGAAEAEGHLRLGSLGGLTFVAGPTDGGLYMAATCPPIEARSRFLASRETSYMDSLRAWPEVAELLSGASRSGPIRVMASWQGYFREPVGPGWALLGDAGNFKDPSPAQGMADALRQGERLAEAVEPGLGEGGDLDAELRRWGSWRDDDAYEMHWFAADMGAGGTTHPLASQVLRDIAADEGSTHGFLRVLNHELRPSQLFTPSLIAGSVARVIRHRPKQVPAMSREMARELHKELRRAWRRRWPALEPAGSPSAGDGVREALLLVLTAIGFLVPVTIAVLVTINKGGGGGLGSLFVLWTASIPSTGLLLDLAVATLVFSVWAAADARRTGVARWWVCVPASVLVGLCFGLPLFLLMRERALSGRSSAPA